jgi:hypothetical protein
MNNQLIKTTQVSFAIKYFAHKIPIYFFQKSIKFSKVHVLTVMNHYFFVYQNQITFDGTTFVQNFSLIYNFDIIY